MGQLLTDPRLHADSLTPRDLQALDSSWGVLNLAHMALDFKPERWLAPYHPAHSTATHTASQDAASSAAASSAAAAAVAGGIGGDGEGMQRPSSLLTFSQGPHVCLGMSLFMAEAKVLLSLIARGYDLTPEDPDSLMFNSSFVTQLKRGKVRVSRLAQAMPFVASDRDRSNHLEEGALAGSSGQDVAAAAASAVTAGV